jgi:DNA segregation ATPase FtsK/SpoIIIE-like protein
MLLETGDSLTRDAVMALVQRGSDVGVHLVMSTQRPQTAVLDNLFKAHISVQIVGRLADSEQARIVTGLQSSQAEYLLGQGDFLAIAGQYMTHFQAAYIGDYDLHLTLQELHRKRVPTLLAQSVEEWQSISLSTLDMDDEVEELPRHFLYKGDSIVLGYEELSPSSAAIEVEELYVEEDEDFSGEAIYVPQPVIRLLHDLPANEIEEVEVIEDGMLDTAEPPYVTLLDSAVNLPEEVTLYGVLAEAHPRPKYMFHKKTGMKAPPTYQIPSEEQLEAEEIDEDTADLIDTVEDDIVSFVESEEPDDNEDEELESEYVQFEDDWLPFDDD